ncbi:MAG: NAD(P)-dependent alcohol dehydrogenase [Dokdonella sp.]
MKAIVYHAYGSPEVLQYVDVAKPTAGDNEVLIRVRAACVNPVDWHLMRGTPYFLRLLAGLRRPSDIRLGADVAGQVEAVGRNVTKFKPGDEVFGACRGAFAEYACGSESALAIKPANVTFEQAGCVRGSALTALQGLRDKGRIQAGQKVLINGAAGGVGTFAVQIAKTFGAEVTGVCSTRNVAMVRSIGADHVIDYTHENFTRSGKHYDLILDSIGNHSLLACRRALSPRGIYIVNGGRDGRWLGPLARGIRARIVSVFVSQDLVMFLARRSEEDLTFMQELIAAAKVTPVIDRRYRLSEVAEAIHYLEQGHARGKVAIAFE